jgi:hypothetical protein
MYEAILGRIDAVSASVGLLREEAKIRRGVNPWGYAGGKVEGEKESRDSSESGASTLCEEDKRRGELKGREGGDLEKGYAGSL